MLADLARKEPEPRSEDRRALCAAKRSGRSPRSATIWSGYKKLSPEKRDDVIAKLKSAAVGSGESAEWARRSLAYLNSTGPLGAIDGLVACSRADDPFLRKEAALALSFWFGTPDENKRAESTLVVPGPRRRARRSHPNQQRRLMNRPFLVGSIVVALAGCHGNRAATPTPGPKSPAGWEVRV